MAVAWDQWNTNYGSFTEGAQQNTTDTNAYKKDKSDYQQRLDDFDKFIETHTPEEALLYFFAMIMTSSDPAQHDNVLGLYDDMLTIYGDQMVVNSQTTVLTNDLQDLINGTVSTTEVPVTSQVTVAEDAIAQMIDAFENDPDVIAAYDLTTTAAILVQLKSIQTTLKTYFSPGAVPYDPQYPPGHRDQDKMQSFEDMKNRMSLKDDGTGNNIAVTAAKEFTDSFQILTSLTQNTNAVLNQKVSEVSGMAKSWEAFFVSLVKSMISLMDAAGKNASRGG